MKKLKIDYWTSPIGKRSRSKTDLAFNLSSMKNTNLISKLKMTSSSTLLVKPPPSATQCLQTPRRSSTRNRVKDRVTEGFADLSRLLDTTDNCDYNDKIPYEIL